MPAGCHADPAGRGGRCGESPAAQRSERPDDRADRPAGGNVRTAVSLDLFLSNTRILTKLNEVMNHFVVKLFKIYSQSWVSEVDYIQ